MTFKHISLRRFFGKLGPGLITGAADDDPSGISTYSVAGASFGFGNLWMVIFTFPMMAAVQLMCARIGMVTGLGLAGVIRRQYSHGVLWFACLLLAIANVVNIGADLGGMAEGMELVTGVPAIVWMPLFAALLVSLLIWSSYRHIVRIFKWLTLVLFAYVAAAFLAHPSWSSVLRATLIPHIELSTQFLMTFVAIIGTSISPYLFFWQAAQEVEEERSKGRRTVHEREGATDAELRDARADVLTGMAFASVVMYFIILTTGATLYVSGQRDIETARQAAEALRPLAGNAAYILFTMGLIGTGLLAVPVLAGSAAYAVTEALHWRGSLNDKPKRARGFYLILAISVALGLALNLLKVNAVRMLFYSAVVNGLLAPPLLVIILLLSNNPKVMGKCTNSVFLSVFGWMAAIVMTVAGVALIALWIVGY